MAINVSSIGTGQDYTTITAWESAVQGDLVSAGDIEKGECIDEAFDEHVVIDGSTTDASNYLWLTYASGAQNDGTSGNGARIVPTSAGHALELSDGYCLIEGLEIDVSSCTGGSNEGVRCSVSNQTIRRCTIHSENKDTTDIDGIYVTGTDKTITVENCFIWGVTRAGIHSQGSSGIIVNVKNCTFYSCGTSAETDRGSISLRSGATGNCDNNIVLLSSSDYDFADANGGSPTWSGDGNISGSTNAFSAVNQFGSQTANLDGRTATTNTSPGAGDWVVLTNITAGSYDLHLQSSAENDAEGNGIDLSGTFTDDFDGDTRSDWDSGADEILAVATSYLLFRRASQRALLRR